MLSAYKPNNTLKEPSLKQSKMLQAYCMDKDLKGQPNVPAVIIKEDKSRPVAKG